MSATAPGTKIALVTGGARRLGAALAADLVKRGWNLWLHYRNSEADAVSLAEKLRRLGPEVQLVQADLAQPGGAESLTRTIAHRPPSLIVHSASAWDEDTWQNASAETWDASHRLHVWTTVVLGRFLAQNGPGHLVTLLDSRSRDRDPAHFSYAFAKRELAQLTRYLALELAPAVRVNGLAPGMVLKADAASAAEWARVGQSSTPLAKTGTPAKLISALRFLIDNDFVTGQILAVDGGRHLKGDLFGSI